MKEITSRDDVKVLVNAFYDRVKRDELLAPVFAHMDWPNHLQIMYNFWTSVLLGDMSYAGSPLAKHLKLPITREHFERWLKLFINTVDSEFRGAIAEEAKNRANSIARIFQHKMSLL